MRTLIIAAILAGNAVFAQEWRTNLDDALRSAQVENKSVLLYFSVPEACAICEKLEKNIWASTEFKAFASDNYILIQPDFHELVSIETKTENLLIVEKYNKDGFFPFVVIMDKNSKILGNTGIYIDETPEMYIQMLKNFR